jgi:NAD(P)H-flavin reductase
MVKAERSAVFLPRPLSVALYAGGTLGFLAAVRGKGSAELAAMRTGEEARLTGPLGRGWADYLPHVAGKPILLLSGGLGIAPLAPLAAELREAAVPFEILTGWRRGTDGKNILAALGEAAHGALIVAEDGSGGHGVRRGLVTTLLDAQKYGSVFACGPQDMMKSAAILCRKAGTPCFVSMETRMACGTGACLGCAVPVRGGAYKRCCADGPVFDAEEVFFDE